MDDVELEAWRAHWQTAAIPPPDLKARVERETRMMRRLVAAEIVVTLVFGGGSATWAVVSRRTDALVLALGIWLFIAVAWAIALLLRRDTWSPASVSTAAFLELSIVRCRRRRTAIAAQSILYVLILVFDLAWIYLSGPERDSRDVLSFLASGGVAWVWPVTAALAIAALRWRHRLGQELDMLVRLRGGLDDENGQFRGEEPWKPRLRMKGLGKRKRGGGASAKS